MRRWPNVGLIFMKLFWNLLQMYHGSHPPWKIWKISFKFSSQGKVREFKKSTSNQGKVRVFYHVYLPKRESGCGTISLLLFHNQVTYSMNNNDWLCWLFGVETPPFLSLAWWLWWIWPIPASWNFTNLSVYIYMSVYVCLVKSKQSL